MYQSFYKAKCPVCGEDFKEGDDIVVCPTCGTPHHRTCYKNLGHCANEALHATGEQWQPPQEAAPEPERQAGQPNAQEGAAPGEVVCPNCGTPNPSQSIFCGRCGAPLHQSFRQPGTPPPYQPNGQGQPGFGGYPPQGGYYVNTFSPLGGFTENDEIEGVKAKDLALYVGKNSGTYLAKFKFMKETGRKTSFSFSGFFLDSVFFTYRKVWWLGLVMLFTTLLLSIPSSLGSVGIYITDFIGMSMPANLESLLNSQTLWWLQYAASILSFAIRIFFGLFANWIYFRHCIKQVKRLRQQYGDDAAYEAALRKKGGVSIPGLIVVAALLFLEMGAITFLVMGQL